MASVFSEIVTGPSAWLGPDLAQDRSWIYAFSAHELAELDAALKRVKARRLALGDIRLLDFPLPSLGPRLGDLIAEVDRGRSAS